MKARGIPRVARRLIATLFLLTGSGAAAAPDVTRSTVPFHGDTRVRLATREEGRALLGATDDFARALGPFDRQRRLRSREPVDLDRFLAFAADQVLAWDGVTRAAITASLANVARKLDALSLRLDLPPEITIIRSTGREEGGAGGYTRGSTIVLSSGMIRPGTAEGLLLHELFHVMTSHRPALRGPIYAAIGFEPCPPLAYPAALVPRRITNPDAYHFDASIEVTVEGTPVRVIPLTLARRLPYERGGLFSNLSVEMLAVEERDGATIARTTDGAPRLYPLDAVSGYRQKIGGNTAYVIHPEEIAADNFSLAVMRRKEVPNPEILAAILEALSRSDEIAPDGS